MDNKQHGRISVEELRDIIQKRMASRKPYSRKIKTTIVEGEERQSMGIRSADGEITSITVKLTTKMNKIFEAYAGNRNVLLHIIDSHHILGLNLFLVRKEE
jgi:hypothetical protein